MFQPQYYFYVTILLAFLATITSDVYFKLALAWVTLSYLAVSLAYLLNHPTIFRKRSDGTIPFYIHWVFLPFLWVTQLYNAWQRRIDPVPSIQEIDTGLYLARRLFPSDVHNLKVEEIGAILDVTAEFTSLKWASEHEHVDYLNLPVLDHSIPSNSQLYKALNWIHTHRKAGKSVVIHCALGRGRSVFVMAAYLLSQRPNASPDDVMEQIRAIRKTARLNKRQFKALRRAQKQGLLKARNTAWLIANPAAGRRQWDEEKGFILNYLSDYYQVTVKTTSPEKNGKFYAKEAVKAHPDIVIACGGDGTVAEVASALVGSSIKLGIIPFGTANALSHVLCGVMSKVAPVETACLNLVEGCEQKIDTAQCNGELMLLMAGVGFEQQMIEKADRAKKNASGQLAYLAGLREAVSQNEVNEFRIQLDQDEPFTIRTPSLTIANAAPITTLLAQGRGLPNFMDGELDLTWLDPDRFQLLNLAELALLGLSDRDDKTPEQREEDSGVFHRSARKVSVDISQVGRYVVDGEVREADQLEIEVNPKSLIVVVPESALNDLKLANLTEGENPIAPIHA